ncbi:Hypothetical protein MVR_LOCUS404 [uncultured virus]|nr:Hypothetical protein MVR_LOCUS404 [uncultured virus]
MTSAFTSFQSSNSTTNAHHVSRHIRFQNIIATNRTIKAKYANDDDTDYTNLIEFKVHQLIPTMAGLLKSCTQLRKLTVTCNLSSHVASVIAKISSLRELDIADDLSQFSHLQLTKLSGRLPIGKIDAMSKFSNLTTLTVEIVDKFKVWHYTNVFDPTLPQLLHLTLTSQLPCLINLSKYPTLKVLKCKMSNLISLEDLLHLTNLEYCELDNNNSNLTTLVPFANLERLKALVLRNVPVLSLQPLQHLMLSTLMLTLDSDSTTPVNLDHINSDHLIHLLLDTSKPFSTQAEEIATLARFANLDTFSYNNLITTRSLVMMTKLTKLYLHQSSHIRIGSLNGIQHLTNLNTLHVSNCDVDDESLVYCKDLPLEHLEFIDTHVQSLTHLSGLIELKTLKINTARVFDHIDELKPLTKLQHLTLDNKITHTFTSAHYHQWYITKAVHVDHPIIQVLQRMTNLEDCLLYHKTKYQSRMKTYKLVYEN